eukprot:6178142-Pleurochrysis_carterae.AAC.2
MDGLVRPCRSQIIECVQLFKAICIDRVSKNVKITKTLHKQRVMIWISAAQGTVVQYCDAHSIVVSPLRCCNL